MKKNLVILGPTATGKTDLALNIAKKFKGELVACDSRQIYKGLDIGTGKESGIKYQVLYIKGKGFWEINGIKIWMYDVADPRQQYTVKYYVEQANKVIEDILQRGKLPIIVGGTGLYLKALFEGLPNLDVPVDKKLRGKLQNFSLKELQEKLKFLSPKKWQSLNESDRKNPRRLLRSIELITMYPYKQNIQNSEFRIQNYDTLKIGLAAPREILNRRIDLRLYSRIDQGLIEETKRLHEDGLTFERMEELGLEYGVLAKLLRGEINKNQFIDELSVKIRQYAKRQMNWFKKEKNINWFDVTKSDWNKKVENMVSSWYYKVDD